MLMPETEKRLLAQAATEKENMNVKVENKSQEHYLSPEHDAWSERMIEGMRRMATDEKFRKEVESKIS
jgi:hypothetical protein